MTPLKDTAFAGRVAYNGFVFGSPGCTTPALRLTGTPEYDEAGRALVQIRYLLEVSAVYAESDANAG